MSSQEGENRTGASHRPYDEAFKRAAVAQWQSGVPASRVEAAFPPRRGQSGFERKISNRLAFEGVLYRARVGCPWRDLPGEYGDHHTVYMRWKHWVKSGVPQRALVASYLEAAQRGELDLSLAMADSTIVRARQHAAEAHKKTAATRRPAARVAG